MLWYHGKYLSNSSYYLVGDFGYDIIGSANSYNRLIKICGVVNGNVLLFLKKKILLINPAFVYMEILFLFKIQFIVYKISFEININCTLLYVQSHFSGIFASRFFGHGSFHKFNSVSIILN